MAHAAASRPNLPAMGFPGLTIAILAPPFPPDTTESPRPARILQKFRGRLKKLLNSTTLILVCNDVL
ncbi:hypothetical protein [Geobacter sp. AOG1]|uniref:hypothetical protein n=1 Tax=Geobacter sp. AOG1 TaxID=1566346 RepID=UPI001CC7B0FC|nr:hypothetical protein [Geobacter sp. AOG1]